MNTFSTTGLIVFCALLGSVFSDRCYSCLEKTDTVCTNLIEDECLEAQCMTAFQRLLIDGREMKSIYKGCANKTMCNLVSEAWSLETFDFLAGVKCYDGELCNKDDVFELPEVDTAENGKKCPACFKTCNLTKCESEKFIACTGAQDKCYDYSGVVETPDDVVDIYSSTGCANNIACVYNFNAAIGTTEFYRNHLGCTDAIEGSP